MAPPEYVGESMIPFFQPALADEVKDRGNRWQKVLEEDPVVESERERIKSIINSNEETSDLLKVANLTKQYWQKEKEQDKEKEANNERKLGFEELDPFDKTLVSKEKTPQGTVAVRGTSFGVRRGEVFTLLGVYGAGKSSTFKCLVGVEPVSGG